MPKCYKHIFFDVDSTLVAIEGLDWLAGRYGKEDIVKELTEKSMNGDLRLEEVFSRKIKMISPCYKDVIALGRRYCESIVEDAREVITLLQALDKQVWLLSGNCKPAVEMLAENLGIPKTRVISNNIYFNSEGRFSGFDFDKPLSKSGGKLLMLNKTFKDLSSVAVIGDGSTDFDTFGKVGIFIGYGGVKCRNQIRNKAKDYIFSKSMAAILLFLLNKEDERRIKNLGYGYLLEKAKKLKREGLVLLG